jgi:hypothetical protein
MWLMKYSSLPVQSDAHARSTTLRDRRAKRPEETLYIMSDQAMSDRVGRQKIAANVRRCLAFTPYDISP